MASNALQELLRSPHLRRGITPAPAPHRWRLEALAGRLVELSAAGASAILTVAVGLVAQAQRQGEPAAWITAPRSCFFPPDVAAHGVDLDALVVIRTEEALARLRAADILARSGGFGLVVLDLTDALELPLPSQTRLAGLAQKHDAALVFLTRKEPHTATLGSLVSLRIEVPLREAAARRDETLFDCTVRALKDKRRGPGWSHAERYRGPPGLR